MPERREALLIACDEFDDHRYKRLAVPILDAQAFAKILGNAEIGQFSVELLANQSRDVITDKLEEFFDKGRPDNVLLLYLAGHGDLDDRGNFYFVARNTKSNRLRGSGIGHHFIHDTMARSLSKRQILILDCCYSGAFSKDWVPRSGLGVGIEKKLTGEGRIVLTASDALEFAYEKRGSTGEVKSLFTSRLIEGMEGGQADLDGDGFISVDELYNYIEERIRSEDPSQKPLKSGFVHGQLWLGRAVPCKDAIPRNVLDLLKHNYPTVRLAGIDELERLLSAQKEILYPAASQILTKLISDEDGTVRRVAASALRRLEAEQREKERLEAEQREKEHLEAEQREKERLEAEQREKERLEQESLEPEQRQNEEQERLQTERRESEAKERLEAERRQKPQYGWLRLAAKFSFVPFALVLLTYFLEYWRLNYKPLSGIEILTLCLQHVTYFEGTIYCIFMLASLCNIFMLVSCFRKYRRKAILEAIISSIDAILYVTMWGFLSLYYRAETGIGVILACAFLVPGALLKTVLLINERLETTRREPEKKERLEAELGQIDVSEPGNDSDRVPTLRHRLLRLAAQFSFVPFALVLPTYFLEYWDGGSGSTNILDCLKDPGTTWNVTFNLANLCNVVMLVLCFLKYRAKAILEVVISSVATIMLLIVWPLLISNH